MPPGRKAAAPFGIFRHDAAPAIGHADNVQIIGNQFSKPSKIPVFRPVGFALGKDDGIVLIQCEQAFATTAGAQDEDGIGNRRRTETVFGEFFFGKLRGATGGSAQFAADHACDIARIDALGEQCFGNCRQMRPGGGQIGDIAGFVDGIAEANRAAGAQSEQISCRQRADQLGVIIDDTEMADFQAIHAADGAIEIDILRHRLKRP